jgi:hypothetical protein
MFSFALVSQIPTESVEVYSVYVELWFRSSCQTVHFSATVRLLKLNNQLSVTSHKIDVSCRYC